MSMEAAIIILTIMTRFIHIRYTLCK